MLPKNARTFLFVLLGLLFGACAAARLPAPPAPAATEPERWIQDAEYALEILLARHPDLDHAEPIARFRAELAPLHADPARLDRDDVYFALMRTVALARDAHTRLADWSEIGDIRLPIGLEPWSDGLWIAFVGRDAQELFGQRVVRIAGRTPEEVTAALRPLVSHENELELQNEAAALAAYPRALREAGLLQDVARVPLELEDRSGRRRTVELASQATDAIGGWYFCTPPEWTAPLYVRSPHEPWWWCSIDEGRILYLRYARCLRRQEHPFDETAAEILARIDQGGVERVWIELRGNPGGDSSVLRPLIDGLERRGYRGDRVLVSTDRKTFSSGMMNAFQLQRELDAVLVGEPSSQKPDSFGEVRTAVLPNTGWPLAFSTKYFRMFGDDRPVLAPDVHVELRFADLLNGRDPVYERVVGRPEHGP